MSEQSDLQFLSTMVSRFSELLLFTTFVAMPVTWLNNSYHKELPFEERKIPFNSLCHDLVDLFQALEIKVHMIVTWLQAR